MKKFKKLVRDFIPPVFVKLFNILRPSADFRKRQTRIIWKGQYNSWVDAKNSCEGYESDVILERCKTALLEVKEGRAKYERDSFLFTEIEYSWGVLSGLLRAGFENDGNLCVLDFGGSLGSSFYQNRNFLSTLKNLEWCIVEQPHFVECGKKFFEDASLKFYYSIESCLQQRKPNVLLLSGVLQYLEKPYNFLESLCKLPVDYIIIDRTFFSHSGREMLTVQYVPKKIYRGSYPTWFFNESKVLGAFSNYENLGSFVSTADIDVMVDGTEKGYCKGFLLKRIIKEV